MKLLYTEQISPNKHRVIGIHNFPYGNAEINVEPVSQEELKKGILVEEFIEPLSRVNKMTLVYINPITKEVWAEYVSRPLTLEEENQILKDSVDKLILDNLNMQMQIDTLILSNLGGI